MEALPHRPVFPRPLALPLRLLPEPIQARMAAQILNQVFQRERLQGELDFIEQRCVRLRTEDLGSAFSLTFEHGRFQAAARRRPADLSLSGSLYDYLSMLSGREDPDTLFFQRRLRMQGDTGLGVYLKNFLASVDPASLPLGTLLQPMLDRGLNLYERIA